MATPVNPTMPNQNVEARLASALAAAAPFIREAPARPPERPDYQAWENPAVYPTSQPPYQLIAALDALSKEILGAGRHIFSGPIGGSNIEPHELKSAMAERIANSVEPSTVARDMVNLALHRHSDVLCVFLVAGISIEVAIDLGDGFDLRPVKDLPPSKLRETLGGIDAMGTFRGTRSATPSVALVFSAANVPVIHDWAEDTDLGTLLSYDTAPLIYEMLRRVLATCVLAGCPNALYVGGYQFYMHPALGYEANNRTHAFANALPFTVAAASLDTARFLEFLPQIRQLSGPIWTTIDLAISRVSRATRADSLADIALDLGIALELLLLHGENEPGAKGELRYKIGTRGAWLVASTFQERRTLFGVYRKLYDDRSKAAHEGRVEERRRAAIEAARADVIRLIVKLVELGRFPDWAELVLGLYEANGESNPSS